MKNTIDIDLLQHYVDENVTLREAVGASAGQNLELHPFAQGEYNANYSFEVKTPTDAASVEMAAADAAPVEAARMEAGSPVAAAAEVAPTVAVEATPAEAAPTVAAETTPTEVRRFLLRVNLGSQMHLENQIEYEMEALRLLAPSGRVPQVFYVDGSREKLPYGVGVESLLSGRPLNYATDLEEAARILADIHAVEASPQCHLVRPAHPVAAIVEECEQMFDVYRSWAQASPALIARMDALFNTAHAIADRDRLRAEPAQLHVVNTEVNSSNFLINEGARSYLIDWEKPVLGEVEQDLGHFLVPTTSYWKTDTRFTRADVDGFVDAYLRAVDGRFACDGLRERLDDYLVVTCLRGLTWCAMAYTEYTGGDRAAENADTFAKIQEYLQDEFLSFVEQEYYGGKSL